MLIVENIWWVLVLIGIMIMIHELGHYWAARFFDVRVEAFSFGFGPRLFGFRKGETDFRVSAILFGGYVKMAGEQAGDDMASDPRSFLSKPRWQRLIIAFAGPFMNIILAVAILTGLFMVKYPKMPELGQPGVLGMVLPNSAAAKAGLKEGDRIIGVNGKMNPSWEDILLEEIASANQPMRIVYVRNGETLETSVTPELDDRNGIGTAGWAEQAEIQIGGVEKGMDAERQGLQRGDILQTVNGHLIRSTYRLREIIKASQGKPVEIVFTRDGQTKAVTVSPSQREVEGQKSWMIGVRLEPRVIYTALGFPDALKESVRQNAKSAGLIYQFLHGIIQQRMSPKSLEGPIRIAQLSGDAAREGPSAFLGLMAMVSLNLAIFNLLPIPILDGGVIVLLLFEMLIRKDLSLNVKEAVMKFGFVFLMMVVVFVLYNDISKIILRG
jgi:regulator of sigma E protease